MRRRPSCPPGGLPAETETKDWKRFIEVSDEPTIKAQLSNHFTISSSRDCIEFEHGPKDHQIHVSGVEPEDFRYDGFLGTGGFGIVLRGRKKTTGQAYAMKIQPMNEMAREANATKMSDILLLHMERTVLAACRNYPFIVTLEFAFTTSRYAALVMEHVEGGTMAGLISERQGRRLPFDVVKTYVIEMTLALHHLHTKGVIYRDLKPSNILLTRNGHIKLADFGLAGSLVRRVWSKEEDKDGSDSDGGSESGDSCEDVICSSIVKRLRPIRRRTVCGTAGYRAPEMIKERHLPYSRRKGYNEKADWFALGVTTYVMLTGRRPFPARGEENSNDGRRADDESENGFIEDMNLDEDEEVETEATVENKELTVLMREEAYAYQFDSEPVAKKFVQELLCRDPFERPAFAEIRLHPWLEDESFEVSRVLKRKFPRWVTKHTQSQHRALKKSFKGLLRSKSKKCIGDETTIEDYVQKICRSAESAKDSEQADKFKSRWKTMPSEETLALFEHWNYISEDAVQEEMKAVGIESSDYWSSDDERSLSRTFH